MIISTRLRILAGTFLLTVTTLMGLLAPYYPKWG